MYCEYCPVRIPDIFVTDYQDLIHGTLGHIVISDGKAKVTGEYEIPVNVDIHVESYCSMELIYPEYDLWIELTLRGHLPRTAEGAHIN